MTDIKSHPDEDKFYAFSFVPKLATGDTLTGTPVVECESVESYDEDDPGLGDTLDLDIGTPTIISTETVIDGKTVPANAGVSVQISGQLDNVGYNLLCKCGTVGGEAVIAVTGTLIGDLKPDNDE
jgi:hypothetical protein